MLAACLRNQADMVRNGFRIVRIMKETSEPPKLVVNIATNIKVVKRRGKMGIQVASPRDPERVLQNSSEKEIQSWY
jgi:hypothetical protein